MLPILVSDVRQQNVPAPKVIMPIKCVTDIGQRLECNRFDLWAPLILRIVCS